jgi:endonuclease-3
MFRKIVFLYAHKVAKSLLKHQRFLAIFMNKWGGFTSQYHSILLMFEQPTIPCFNMTKKERASFIIDRLNQHFPHPSIPLHHESSYTLLIAVLLSAQCTDERVNRITPSLFAKANNPFDMVKLSIEEIRNVIRPCGLSPTKAKAIHGLSELLIKNHQGDVPDQFDQLEALPGVGHKTASVVMSQAFGIPAFPVDTHIHRLAYRWGLSNGKNVVQTEKDCKKWFPKSRWNTLHLQIIYFGRAFCPARGHDAKKCPICSKIGIKALFN